MDKTEFFSDGLDTIESLAETGVSFVTVLPKNAGFDHSRRAFLWDVLNLGIDSVTDVKIGRTFLFDGFSADEINEIRRKILHEETHMDSHQGKMKIQALGDPAQFVCVTYQKQVSNPEITSLEHAIQSIGISLKGKSVQSMTWGYYQCFNCRIWERQSKVLAIGFALTV